MKYVERKWATILRNVSENAFEVLQFEIEKKKKYSTQSTMIRDYFYEKQS